MLREVLIRSHTPMCLRTLSFELTNLERHRATKFIARLFINITVFKDICKRVLFVG